MIGSAWAFEELLEVWPAVWGDGEEFHFCRNSPATLVRAAP